MPEVCGGSGVASAPGPPYAPHAAPNGSSPPWRVALSRTPMQNVTEGHDSALINPPEGASTSCYAGLSHSRSNGSLTATWSGLPGVGVVPTLTARQTGPSYTTPREDTPTGRGPGWKPPTRGCRRWRGCGSTADLCTHSVLCPDRSWPCGFDARVVPKPRKAPFWSGPSRTPGPDGRNTYRRRVGVRGAGVVLTT